MRACVCGGVRGDTFQEKRHERDLGRFHPLEGFPIGFVIQRWILKEDGGQVEKERKQCERNRLEKEKRFQDFIIKLKEERISWCLSLHLLSKSHRDELQL